MPKDDLLNIIAELKRLNIEVQVLKEENKYLRKKSEIAPLVAIYNHVTGQGKPGLITITKRNGDVLPHGQGNESVMVKNDKLLQSTGKGLKEICDIDDISKVQLGDFEYDLR